MMSFIFSSHWWLSVQVTIFFGSHLNFKDIKRVHLESSSLRYSLARSMLTAYCLSLSPMEIILLLSGITLFCHSDPTSICSLLFTLHSSSVCSHSSTPQLGNVFSGVAHLLVCAMLQARELLLEQWERSLVTELRAEHAILPLKRECALLPQLRRAVHSFFFFQTVQSHRCPAASLCYTLLLEAGATVLAQDTPFYVRACKGMGFEGRQAVQVRLSERGAVHLWTQAVIEGPVSVRRFSVFYLSGMQNLEAKSFADLQGQKATCRSLDSALCMVSSVLRPSPMAGEIFPWWIQCSISYTSGFQSPCLQRGWERGGKFHLQVSFVQSAKPLPTVSGTLIIYIWKLRRLFLNSWAKFWVLTQTEVLWKSMGVLFEQRLQD